MMPPYTSIPQDERSILRIEQGWHNDLLAFVQNGLPKVLVACVIAFILQRIVIFFVNRMRRRADAMVGNAQRAAQLRTVAGITRASAYAFILAYLIVQVLGAIGVPLGPFIASAGVIGLGISFGAQSIFKDMLNGIFILVEDQFNVGDTIKAATLTGAVEDLTLRVTKLRDGDGTLHIIPNSQITTVSNLSRDYSVATLQLSVASSEDPTRILALLRSLTDDLRNDEAFKDVLIAAPDLLGVDKISAAEVVYPVNLRVRANQKDPVLRELRKRILVAFTQQNILFGAATSTLFLERK